MGLPIEAVKKGLLFVVSGVGAAKNATADGKLDLQDLVYVMPLLLQLPDFIKALPLIPKQFADIDKTEKAELEAFGAAEIPKLGVTGDTKEIVERSYNVLVGLGHLLEAF